jgi:hypothetical protein
MGATAFGVTSLVFVTGGGTKSSSYWNSKARSVYRGVCAEVYQKEVLPILLQEVKRLFKGRDGLIIGFYSRTMHVLM